MGVLITIKAVCLCVKTVVLKGWGQLNDGVSEVCDSPNHLRVGEKVCSLTKTCVAHKI
jgi:hypothetical protein